MFGTRLYRTKCFSFSLKFAATTFALFTFRPVIIKTSQLNLPQSMDKKLRLLCFGCDFIEDNIFS